jgi:hypothetical protein
MSSSTAIAARTCPAGGPASQAARTVTSGTASTPSALKARTSSASTLAAPAATTVAGYLLSRLAEAGVISVFGVPGDCNLGLLDVEAVLGWDDAPPLLRDLARVPAARNNYASR